jgi:hypothetical protein
MQIIAFVFSAVGARCGPHKASRQTRRPAAKVQSVSGRHHAPNADRIPPQRRARSVGDRRTNRSKKRPERHRRVSKPGRLACVIGNALEWYDFALYALFVTIIARLYCAARDAAVALPLAFATFGVGFAIHPPPCRRIRYSLQGVRRGRSGPSTTRFALMDGK